MNGCSIPGPVDMDDLIVKGNIAKMLSDNYTLLGIFAVVSGILIIVLIYFIKDTKSSLTDYLKNKKLSAPPANADSEPQLTGEDIQETDPAKYQDFNKQKFMQDVNSTFKEYNTEKGMYVKANYGKDNDDKIDSRIAYQRYDDYEY